MDLNESVGFVVRSMKSRIADAIVAKLNDVWDLKTVSFDRVRVLVADFNEGELPAAQIIDQSETILHEQNRARKSWNLTIEIVMKQTVDRLVNQQDLWNLMYQIERKLFVEPNLAIPGVLHMRYVQNVTDLHLADPYYTARLDLAVEYYEALVREC